ncbi:unnamed protein product, partial [Didymodactylos carnosus]
MNLGDHEQHVSKIQKQIRLRAPDQRLSLHKRIYDSNTIRNSTNKQNSTVYKPVNIQLLNKILSINLEQMQISVQPGVIFQDLVVVCLKYNVVPLVVVEFPSMTIGGAIQ